MKGLRHWTLAFRMRESNEYGPQTLSQQSLPDASEVLLREKVRKHLAINRHPERRVHAEGIERRDLLVGGDAARGGEGQAGRRAQATEPIDIRSLKLPLRVDVSAQKFRAVRLKLRKGLRRAQVQRLV